MMTILLTCLLTAGATFTPPPQWEIVRIVAPESTFGRVLTHGPICVTQGSMLDCPPVTEGGIPTYARIELRRTLKLGERVTGPEGCTLSIEAPGGEKP
jgi:hypothetical protein